MRLPFIRGAFLFCLKNSASLLPSLGPGISQGKYQTLLSQDGSRRREAKSLRYKISAFT
jgi:hypothetical protein